MVDSHVWRMTSRVTALVGALTIRITKSTSRRTGCPTINSPWVSVSTEVLHRLCCCCRTMKTTAMTTIVETTHLYANVDRRPNDIFGLVRTCLDDVHMAGRQWRSLLMQWLHLTSTRRSSSLLSSSRVRGVWFGYTKASRKVYESTTSLTTQLLIIDSEKKP